MAPHHQCGRHGESSPFWRLAEPAHSTRARGHPVRRARPRVGRDVRMAAPWEGLDVSRGPLIHP